MKIEVLYLDGCPHHRPAVERIQTILQEEGITASVSEIEIRDQEAAMELGFPGSPTIRVDGVDIEPAFRGVEGAAFACRRYHGGLPSEDMIRTALREVRGGGRTVTASVAAIGSVILASACCLPILPFVFAAGAAGSSALLTALRPYLLALSIAFIAYGFYQAWRTRQCKLRPRMLSSIVLWTAAVFVALSIFFPQVLANAAAGLLAR